jgi:hypothetical protein
MTALTSKPQLAAIRKIGLKPGKEFEIVDQPSGKAAYVSEKSDALTNFQLPLKYGNYGFIAHNYLAGKEFSQLRIGDILTAEDKQGTTRKYRITRIEKFQALDPKSPRSKFVDLSSNKTLTADEVFKRVYTGDHRLVLQTCISKDGNHEWGRMFIIAKSESALEKLPPFRRTSL